ncbi:hypothetical protein ACHAXR_000222, partial [Thalassiosira sp. AJA248-18]
VTRVRVDASVTRIPPRAFLGLKKLEEVELCEGMEEIGGQIFFNCRSLRRITLPSTLLRIPDYAFYLCQKLEEVELSEGLLEIGADAFGLCESLRHIIIPNTVRAIGKHAFFCTPLPSIDLPDSLEHIGASAFSGTRLQMMRIPPLVVDIDNFGLKVLFSVELPEGIKRINNYAFHNRRSLRNIAIPSNSVIEGGAFGGETDL